MLAALEEWLFPLIHFLIGVNASLFVTIVALAWHRSIENKSPKNRNFHLLTVIGSGGHTTEMLKLLHSLGDRYSPRTYVIASTDQFGQKKVSEIEGERRKAKQDESESTNRVVDQVDSYTIEVIPRSREVKQSYWSAIWTTLIATAYSLALIWRVRPDVVLCNGPGTGLPICVIASLFDLLRVCRTKVIFVESICRVQSLSLTGLVLYRSRLAHCMLVQWPELAEKYPRAKYIGRLV